MSSDNRDVAEEQFRNAYNSGMGFLMKHFLKVTSEENKFNKMDSIISGNTNYLIESNNMDVLMQVASFVVHKNVYYVGDNKYPNFKGFSYRHYKKLMDDMMNKSPEYETARDNDILIVYFPRDIYGCDNIIPNLVPIINGRDGDKYINLILTTNNNITKYFKHDDMTSDKTLIHKVVNFNNGIVSSKEGVSQNEKVF